MMARIRLKFFARYAELVGKDELQLNLSLPATVADVVRRARTEIPGAGALPERPLAAVNLRHVRLDAPVADGDEVAFLPPLAGG
jgi:molybdopterin synthase sulfur carrier subunit